MSARRRAGQAADDQLGRELGFGLGGRVSDRGCVGVDVGGTFTDFFVVGPGGVRLAKRPSTSSDPARAVLEGLAALDPGADLAVAHGTTVATNALLERRGARTAFVTTAGFGDLLALGRGERAELYALRPAGRAVLVPPELCFEVAERLAADGTVLVPLAPAEIERLGRRIAAAEPESVAICLLFSYLNPAHERALGAHLATLPGGPGHVSLSVEVLPEVREYERASTVAVNAYVAPIMARYLSRLAEAAAPRRLSVMASHAGTLPPALAARFPVATVLSGPAAGVSAALAVARRAGFERILSFDMGGTSTDVALCDRAVPFSAWTAIGGLAVHRPAVDVHTIGAGGGSIVRLDAGGGLRVGPQSAGAEPGPAAYGRGGLAPTVTDAQLILGRLPLDRPLAGGLRLDPERSRAAFGPLAQSLGQSLEQVALGAVAVADARMERALRRVSVERGASPGDLTLVAFGGAGPLHACGLAEAIGASRVLVPAAPGALSAIGLATAAPVATASRSVLGLPAWDAPSGSGAPESFEPIFQALEMELLGALPGIPRSALSFERLADLRYRGQSWEITVPWPPGGDALAAFEAAHAARYGYARPGTAVEMVTLRLRAEGPAPAELPPPPPLETGPPRTSAARIFLADGSSAEAPVYPRFAWPPGSRLRGPALLCQVDSSTYLAPGWAAEVGAWGDLVLARG